MGRWGSGASLSSKAVYSTKVGMHWPRVVRTARTPDPHGVHPTLFQ